MSDLTIYINTHKNYQWITKNKNVYKIVCNTNDDITNTDLDVYRSDNKNDIDNIYDILSDELKNIYWIHNNLKTTTKYIGFCHYRRLFPFLDNIPNLDDIFKTYDCIAGEVLNTNIFKQFVSCHSFQVWGSMLSIFDACFKDYMKTVIKLMNNDYDLPFCCMIIIPTKDFDKLYNFIVKFIKIFFKTNNIKNKEDINTFINKAGISKTNQPHRIIGFVIERLIVIFCLHNYSKIYKQQHIKI